MSYCRIVYFLSILCSPCHLLDASFSEMSITMIARQLVCPSSVETLQQRQPVSTELLHHFFSISYSIARCTNRVCYIIPHNKAHRVLLYFEYVGAASDRIDAAFPYDLTLRPKDSVMSVGYPRDGGGALVLQCRIDYPETG